MTTYVTSRTHAQDYLNCKRFRFLRTLYRGTGLEPVRNSIPLVVGSSVHAAIESILNHIIDHPCSNCDGSGIIFHTPVGELFSQSTVAEITCPECGGKGGFEGCKAVQHGDCTGAVDYAVEQGLKYYRDECAKREVDIGPDEDMNFVAQEQLAMIEAIIRGWIKVVLPQLLSEYNIIGVEREDVFKLADLSECSTCSGNGVYCGPCALHNAYGEAGHYHPDTYAPCPDCNGSGDGDALWWQSRADIDLQHRKTGELFVGSIKNLKEWKALQILRAQIDMQGHSETYAAEQARGQNYSGVQMLVNIKGAYKKGWSADDGVESGPRTYQSFLVHPIMKDAPVVGDPEFAWNDKWQCAEPHKQANGHKCVGGKNHKLTAAMGWRKVNVWEEISIKNWIDLLYDNKVQGGPNPLSEVLKLPFPHVRNRNQIESWLRQTTAQEVQVAQDGELVNSLEEGSQEYLAQLDARFPMNTDHCIKYGETYKCEFYSICHESLDDPLATDNFQRRVPHHQKEKELFAKNGFSV